MLSKDSYSLRLGNGQEWSLIARGDMRGWLGQFARILQIKAEAKPCKNNGQAKLFFTRKNLVNPVGNFTPKSGLNNRAFNALPRRGWQGYELSALSFYTHPKAEDILCEMQQKDGYDSRIMQMWETLLAIYQKAVLAGGLALHAALIVRGGLAVTLAASGNTGKSTCCRRLPLPWRALCDDETLIVTSLNKQKKYLAHPFPTWSEYLLKRSRRTFDVETCAPLKALFFLEQAENDEFVPLEPATAVAYINNSAGEIFRRIRAEPKLQWKLRENIFTNACQLAQNVPAFILRFSLQGKFWEKIEQALNSA